MRTVLVDPSRTVLRAVETLLAARNYDVRSFCDGQKALEHIKSDSEVAVLITSAELISMSGVELCWQTRLLASQGRPIYIILMSSNSDPRKLAEGLDSGADDFIGKPPGTVELFARLRAAERLVSMQRELIRLATRDPLTGLLNRRAFFERAEEAHGRATLVDATSVIMIDVDHFKRINDGYGHDVGDQILRAIAQEIIAENAIIGRLGGEEFASVLQGRPLSEAREVAEKWRVKISSLDFESNARAIKMTCSFGLSSWQAGETIDGVLKRADVALYAAKTLGRNRVIVGESDDVPTLYDGLRHGVRSSSRA